MVDVLVLTCSDQVPFILKLDFPFFYKQTYIDEEFNRTEPFLLVRVPCTIGH